MMKKLRSIRLRIVVLYLVLLTVALLFAGFFLQNSLKGYFLQWFDKRLIGEMNLLIRITKPLIEKKEAKKLDDLAEEYGKKLEARITIVDRQGIVLADSREEPKEMDNHLQRPEIQQALQTGLGKETRYSATLGLDMKYLAIPIKSQGNVIGIMRVALDLSKIKKMYRGIWWVLFQVGIITFFISIILSLKFASNITEPIEKMTNIVERISEGSLDQKIKIDTKDEIGQLAKMFNQMVNRVKEKVEQISNEKSKIEAIVGSIGDGVIAVNLNKEVLLINLAARDIFNVEEDVIGKSLINITKNHKLEELIDEALSKSESLTEEIELLLPEERTFRIRLAPIIREEKAIGVVISLRDITDIRQLQQMRTEFVSNVSHELKTPLTSIKGYVETLLETEADEETYESFLEVIKNETNRLELLIDDILNLSKIESGVNELEKKVDINKVVSNLLSLLKPKAVDKNINLKLALDDNLPLINGDYNQLSRMMINLIDNAIKYTPEGGKVEVEASSKDQKLVVEVKDNGIGIPEEDLVRIFERFYRVDKGRSRKLGGTGLGLSIVKHIVENHHGDIRVDSEVEQGTTFTIEFPIA
ncbi:two-component system histidine kinase PnpS [Halanaerobacter jeridensis]|uniref:histidine kinase n=1 Tax=Halanaerobacter jeridensis TaxID=706427 RepID=A0A938XQ24_9FIRM|nr:ATP-binding protein [Halanaerobacter jeridensis]MBM7555449.1 two-component system phosphate regulon sensor histidine kinase PhoR [Halanaerobacter jeridensis]